MCTEQWYGCHLLEPCRLVRHAITNLFHDLCRLSFGREGIYFLHHGPIFWAKWRREFIMHRWSTTTNSIALLLNAKVLFPYINTWFSQQVSSVPWKCQKKFTMLLRDKGLQSSLQKIVTFMFQALVLVHNIVTSVWYIYFCCTALCSLLLSFYSIVKHSKAENCHFHVSGFYISRTWILLS